MKSVKWFGYWVLYTLLCLGLMAAVLPAPVPSGADFMYSVGFTFAHYVSAPKGWLVGVAALVIAALAASESVKG
jgi:hypothetical protein